MFPLYLLLKGGAKVIDFYIRQYGRRLYGLCLTLCKNTEDAQDLYQDTWLKVLNHIDSYDTSKEFEPWLTTICVNTYRNLLRQMKRSLIKNYSSLEEQEAALSSVCAPTNPDYSDLHEAINRLPNRLRLTVILFYFHEMEIPLVAYTLGIPPGTVKSRLHKARKLLKEVLNHESDLPF